MMKLKTTTAVLAGGLVGTITDGIMIGAGAGALIFIAYQLEKHFDHPGK